MEIQILKSTWWYRVLKVISIIAIVLFLGGWFRWWLIETKPPLRHFYYQCDDGRKIYGSGIPEKTSPLGQTFTDYNALKELCTGGYKRINVYKIRDWGEFIGGCLVGIVLIWLFFEIIRGIFFYVATGKWVAFKYRKK